MNIAGSERLPSTNLFSASRNNSQIKETCNFCLFELYLHSGWKKLGVVRKAPIWTAGWVRENLPGA